MQLYTLYSHDLAWNVNVPNFWAVNGKFRRESRWQPCLFSCIFFMVNLVESLLSSLLLLSLLLRNLFSRTLPVARARNLDSG